MTPHSSAVSSRLGRTSSDNLQCNTFEEWIVNKMWGQEFLQMQFESQQHEHTCSSVRKQSDERSEEIQADTPIEEDRKQCRCCFVAGYFGIFFFVIMAIIYILIQYALIKKYEFSLSCDSQTLTCTGKIDNIYTQKLIYFQLETRYPASRFFYPLDIENISLSNQNHTYYLRLAQIQQGSNAYINYRQFVATGNCSLIYSYNITVKFANQIPLPFKDNLNAIIRQSGLFNQDQTINQAILCLVFASCISFFNISSKIMEDKTPTKNIQEKQPKLHKFYYRLTEESEEIDEKLQSVRERSLKRILRKHKRTAQLSDSDSDYSSLAN